MLARLPTLLGSWHEFSEQQLVDLPPMQSFSLSKVVGSEDRWVAAPMFTLLRIEGTGNIYTALGRVKYPDGLTWHTAAVVERRDNPVARVTWIFGAP